MYAVPFMFKIRNSQILRTVYSYIFKVIYFFYITMLFFLVEGFPQWGFYGIGGGK